MAKLVGLGLLLVAGLTYAQSEPPAVDDKKSQVTSPVDNSAKHARHSDARHCLDLKTNQQIIACAHRYRWRR